MRETNKIISIDRTYKEDVVLNKEEIAKYTVDKRNQTITVDVRLSGDETSIVETETYRFFSNDFINEPNEYDLWLLIDNKRSGV
jgi:hypothetical protein